MTRVWCDAAAEMGGVEEEPPQEDDEEGADDMGMGGGGMGYAPDGGFGGLPPHLAERRSPSAPHVAGNPRVSGSGGTAPRHHHHHHGHGATPGVR